MSNERNHIDLENFFRHGVENYDIQFNESDWVKMEKMLDDDDGKGGFLPFNGWKLPIILLLSVLLSSLVYYFGFLDSQESIASNSPNQNSSANVVDTETDENPSAERADDMVANHQIQGSQGGETDNSMNNQTNEAEEGTPGTEALRNKTADRLDESTTAETLGKDQSVNLDSNTNGVYRSNGNSDKDVKSGLQNGSPKGKTRDNRMAVAQNDERPILAPAGTPENDDEERAGSMVTNNKQWERHQVENGDTFQGKVNLANSTRVSSSESDSSFLSMQGENTERTESNHPIAEPSNHGDTVIKGVEEVPLQRDNFSNPPVGGRSEEDPKAIDQGKGKVMPSQSKAIIVNPDDREVANSSSQSVKDREALTNGNEGYDFVNGPPLPTSHGNRGEESAGKIGETKIEHKMELERKQESLPAESELPEEEENQKKESFNHHWSISLMVAPDFSLTPSGRFTSPGGLYGMKFHYEIVPRFGISAGVLRSNKKYVGTGEDYTPPKGFWGAATNGMVPDKIEGSCTILEVPVELSYDILRREKSTLILFSGITGYHMSKERYGFIFDQPNPGAAEEWKSRTTSDHPFSVLSLSLRYEVILRRNLSVGIEPYYKLPFAGVGWANIDLRSTGFYFTGRYFFGGRR